jgi:alkyl hydroperoxide reductase subunit AhpC
MKDAYAAASTLPNLGDREVIIDGLNNLYRSKAFRDYIKSHESIGTVDKRVIKDMQRELSRYRHYRRHPAAKAWRYQWP